MKNRPRARDQRLLKASIWVTVDPTLSGLQGTPARRNRTQRVRDVTTPDFGLPSGIDVVALGGTSSCNLGVRVAVVSCRHGRHRIALLLADGTIQKQTNQAVGQRAGLGISSLPVNPDRLTRVRSKHPNPDL